MQKHLLYNKWIQESIDCVFTDQGDIPRGCTRMDHGKSKAKVKFLCYDCNQFICRKCEDIHTKVPSLKSHCIDKVHRKRKSMFWYITAKRQLQLSVFISISTTTSISMLLYVFDSEQWTQFNYKSIYVKLNHFNFVIAFNKIESGKREYVKVKNNPLSMIVFVCFVKIRNNLLFRITSIKIIPFFIRYASHALVGT